MTAEFEKFDVLGDKIRKLVEVIRGLRGENEALRSDLNETRKQVAALASEKERLLQVEQEKNAREEELDRIRKERDEVRRKVEALLGDLEGIDLG